MARTAVACLAALLALSTAAAAQTKDAVTEKLIADYTAAWAKGDAVAIAGFYSDDVLFSGEQGLLQGRAAVQKSMTENFAGPYMGSTIAITEEAAHALAPDTRVSAGRYTITGVKGKDGKAVPPIAGRYSNTLVSKGGRLLIAGSAVYLPEPPAAR
jgi:uncharacterized protein (TIGR02246 family)